MSIFDRTAEDLAGEIGVRARRIAGALRRMTLAATTGGRWRLLGHASVKETLQAEVFSGAGFAARPPAGQGEVVVAFLGGGSAPVVIAVRDEKTRAAIAGALAADESAIYNSVAIVHLTAGGTIEARSASGAASALATKADLEAVVAYVRKQFAAATGHVHATPSGTTSTITEGTVAGGTCPSPAGTTVLKGE